MNELNVTKCSNCKVLKDGSRCVDRHKTPAGLSTESAYYLEKYVLCRLQRCARPCGSRSHFFPKLLAWDDSRLTLVQTNEGVPLAHDMRSFQTSYNYTDVAMEAELRGLGPPEQQFECMRQQLVMADVVNLDMGCKNIFYKDGSLTREEVLTSLQTSLDTDNKLEE